ncbi:MAG: TonB-dependent receptor family protein [Gemmatimonadota bacterium]
MRAWRRTGWPALLVVTLASPAHAQVGRPGAPDTLPWHRAEPLTVTILRDPLPLAEAPFSVSVVHPDSEAALRPTLSLDEALAGVPGVQVDDRHNEALGERISIRGFGARSQFGVRGLKVIVDGVPATMADGQTALSHVDPATIARAEVIRGAGSALWGNASGGVILLETADPPAAPFLAAGATAGSFGLKRIGAEAGDGGGQLGWRARVAGVESEGHRRFSDARHVFAGSKLRHSGDRMTTLATFAFVDYEAENPGALPDSMARADPRAAFPLNIRQRTGERARQGQAGVTARRPLGGAEFELGAWGLLREVDNPIPLQIIDLGRSAGGLRAIWRRTPVPEDASVHFVLGADLNVQRDSRRNFENTEGDRGELVLDQRETVRALGPFAQVRVPLGDRLRLHAALRYDRIRFAVDDRLLAGGDPDDSGRRTMEALSPGLGLALDAGAGVTVYGHGAKGFDTPTTSELANRPDGAGGLNPALDPQRSFTVELGARARRRGWSAEAALFRTRVEDALVPFQVPEVPGRDFFRNAGSAVHRGLEIALDVDPGPGSSIRLAYSWVVARFDRFRTEAAVFDGRRVPGVAPHRVALSFGQAFPGGWRFDLQSRYRSRMPVDDANRSRTEAWWIADLLLAHAGLAAGGTRIVPFLGVTNLFDESYTASVTVNAFGGRYFEPGPPRAAYAGVRVVRGEG